MNIKNDSSVTTQAFADLWQVTGAESATINSCKRSSKVQTISPQSTQFLVS